MKTDNTYPVYISPAVKIIVMKARRKVMTNSNMRNEGFTSMSYDLESEDEENW